MTMRCPLCESDNTECETVCYGVEEGVDTVVDYYTCLDCEYEWREEK